MLSAVCGIYIYGYKTIVNDNINDLSLFLSLSLSICREEELSCPNGLVATMLSRWPGSMVIY